MPEIHWLIPVVVACALLFGFANGWNDAANAIATVISTRVLSPGVAVALAAVMNIAGGFFGVAVALTIGRELIDPAQVTQPLLLAALLAGMGWSLTMTLLSLPISASHALIGGLVGAALAHGGPGMISAVGIGRVLFWMLLSPLAGGLLGWLLMKLIQLLLYDRAPESVGGWFRRLQLLSAAGVPFAHGTADGQKVMGVIALSLFAGGLTPKVTIPLWVMGAAALALSLGTAAGGWRLIGRQHMRILRIQPVHGFASEAAAAGLLLATAAAGVPISGTHTITGAVMGVGVARRFRAVRWVVARPVLSAWVVTLPGCAVVAYLLVRLLGLLI